jgi:hypothetical protein
MCLFDSVGCGSGMFIPDRNFSTADPGSNRFRIPVPDPHQIIQIFLTLKTVSKLSEKLSGKFIPDPVFFPARFQRSKKFRIPEQDPQHCFYFLLERV